MLVYGHNFGKSFLLVDYGQFNNMDRYEQSVIRAMDMKVAKKFARKNFKNCTISNWINSSAQV